jgi:hypothetical protein
MGTDIHWIFERRDHRGAWHAVASKTQLRKDLISIWNDLPWDDPRCWFGDRNYDWFGIASALRRPPKGQVRTLAHTGFPNDVSSYAATEFDWRRPVRYGLHTHGYFTLGDFDQALGLGTDGNGASANDDILPDEESLSLAQSYRNCLDLLISGPQRIEVDRFLGEDDSNHARFQRAAREAQLAPVGPESFRILIAYDS